MRKLIFAALIAFTPIAHAMTDSDVDAALKRVREQAAGLHVFVSEESKEALANQELKDEVARISKRTGIPEGELLRNPGKPDIRSIKDQYDRAVEDTLGGTPIVVSRQDVQGIDWVGMSIALLLSAAALLVGSLGVRSAVRYLRGTSGTREKVIENSKRLATFVVLCAVLGSFATSSTYEIADTEVPKWAVMAAVWLALIGAVYGVARLSRPAQLP
jgi:hypothetical protein